MTVFLSHHPPRGGRIVSRSIRLAQDRKLLKEQLTVCAGDILIIVDVQGCFLPGGVLGVSGADRIIPLLNRVIGIFVEMELPVLLSRDWHPLNHCSFRERGGPWPRHCVQNTPEAGFSPELKLPGGVAVFSKGTDPDREEYSAWLAKDEEGKTLRERIGELSAKRLFIGGLTTEYCVLNTIKDARLDDYDMYVIEDAVRAVDVNPGDGAKALEEMVALGATLVGSETIRAA